MSDTLDKKQMLKTLEIQSKGWKAAREHARKEADSAQEIIEVLDHLKDLIEIGRFDTKEPASRVNPEPVEWGAGDPGLVEEIEGPL